MKKLVLLLLATMMATLSQATITPTENQIWWGYFNESEVSSLPFDGKLGYSTACTISTAMGITKNQTITGGAQINNSVKIEAIRFWLGDDISKINSDVTVWISSSLPSNVSSADYKQTISKSSLKQRLNEIKLITPYTAGGTIYLGYSFTISDRTYPVMSGGDGVSNGFYYKVSDDSWENLNSYGNLALQVLLDGIQLQSNSAQPADFGKYCVEKGATKTIPVEITNTGKSPITSISYTITTNGSVSSEKSVNTSSIPYSATKTVDITLPADATEGTVEKTITITKVNGKANEASKKTAKGVLVTVANLKVWSRNVLIEEFTTESCGYCPDAAAGLSSFMTTYPDLAKKTAVVCHHAGFYTDWLTIDASESYTWLYNSGGTYAPAFMYDRYAGDGKTAVVSRGNYKGYVEQRVSETSNANINLTASFNADKSAINVVADCERGWDFSSTPARITIFLTEDNITAHSQSGASGTFIHQHVLRAVNETWGSVISWSGNKARYTYKFNVDSSWKTDDLKVVAMISAYDQYDATKCVVENSAKTTIDPAAEVVDLPTLVQLIMTGQYVKKADLNNDNKVDAADIVELVKILK